MNSIPSVVEPPIAAPLSFGQRRLWFLDQMAPGSVLYNIPYLVRLKGRLDVAALRRALRTIVERHESLRTTFAAAGAEPTQIVAEHWAFEVEDTDLSEFEEDAREMELTRLARDEARRPFNLSADLMIRARLFRLREQDHALILVLHHIAADGWSISILFRELSAWYNRFSGKADLELPELPIQYADYASWQQTQVQGPALQSLLEFWKDRLKNVPPLLELPADRPRPSIQTYRGTIETVVFSPDLLKALHDLSRRERSTLYMTLFAAFAVLVHRTADRDDIVVGSLIAGRDRTEMEELIGFFVNLLVMRTDLSGDPSFREALARVRDMTLSAYDHHEMPYERLVEELEPKRSLNHSPLCQIAFTLQNTPDSSLNLADLDARVEPVYTGTAKFDLALFATEEAGGLGVLAEYNTDLFDRATIQRLLEHFRSLLEGIVANPDEAVSRLPLLSAAERNQVLVEWNATDLAYPKDRCIHHLFAEQLARTPDAQAVVFEEHSFTYRELDHAAARLAQRLREKGVGPETIVALCVDRSLEMVVGLLGILKAGGAYLPLDPAYPQERLAFMLRDSRAPVLVTQHRLLAHLGEHDAAIVELDGNEVSSSQSRGEGLSGDIPGEAAAENLAVVLYTSGSTGRPKGVMIPHRNVVNFFAGIDRELGNEPGVWLAVASISFDTSILELFWTLCRGFMVVILSDEAKGAVASHTPKEPGRRLSVAELIERRGVTHMQCTPSLWRTHLQSPESRRALRGLRHLATGGEALPAPLAAELLQATQGVLHCCYGPTETTIYSTGGRVERTDGPGVIPLGRPFANTRILILDRNLQLVPIGVTGEIYIGGDGVARGYLNRPELTREKFISDPFCPGSTIYRSGDLGRYRPDGVIEFLGRTDHQVKLRGYRIELGEIESVLSSHPAVRACAVILDDSAADDPRLLAYLVPAVNGGPAPSELRDFLRKKLPEHMVPSDFVSLQKLPLTPSGKLDRPSLPAPEGNRSKLDTAFTPPQSALERTIAGIWEEVLAIKNPGVDDNFFDLGGHSLLVVRVQNKLREAIGANLYIVKLFQYPTIRSLARHLADEKWSPVFMDKIRERTRRRQEVSAVPANPPASS